MVQGLTRPLQYDDAEAADEMVDEVGAEGGAQTSRDSAGTHAGLGGMTLLRCALHSRRLLPATERVGSFLIEPGL